MAGQSTDNLSVIVSSILYHWNMVSSASVRVPTHPGKSWIFFLDFTGPGKSWKISLVQESPGSESLRSWKVLENDPG